MKSALYPVKIIIADDHEIFREGFRSMLQNEPSFELLAEAANGLQLVKLAQIKDPDVILTDIKMPVMNGIEATKILTREQPRSAIIALTMCNEEYLVADMLAAGAKGYLLKDARKREVLKAIHTVNSNHSYYCRATSRTVTRLISKNLFDPDTNECRPLLAPRETEILLLICLEKTSREISEILNISSRTVEDCRNGLMIKTGSHNTAGLVTFAIRQGIFRP
jgi:DNA-binding NarL/FixJ family response regulator